MEEAKTHKKTYDWLKPYHFKEGNPGGPGRPKGPTLKTWIQERFSEMTDDERVEFLNQIEPIKAWEMGEGKAQTNTDLTSGGQTIQFVTPDIVAKRINETSTDTPS